MKKLLLLLLIVVNSIPTANAQSDLVGGGKVKKKKKTNWGVGITAGTMGYSFENYSIENGVLLGINAILTTPLSANPEARWLGELSFGFDYCNNEAKYNKNPSYTSYDTSTFTMDYYIDLRFRYIINPMSTRGKWYLYPGFSVSLATLPLGVDKSLKSFKGKELTTEVGVGLTGECGIGYATKHLGFSAGPFAKVGAVLSDEKGGAAPLMYGAALTLFYMF